MEDMLRQACEELIGRAAGPMHMRLLVQPAVAVFLAIRAGLKDAREGKTPYGWTILSDSAQRKHLLQDGWKDIAKVFVMAVVLDIVYSLVALHRIFPIQTLIVAIILAIVPYLLLRGLVTRLTRSTRK
jgi:hypothetical protein